MIWLGVIIGCVLSAGARLMSSKQQDYLEKHKRWIILDDTAENDTELTELAGELDDLWWMLTDDERAEIEKQTGLV